MLTLTNALTVNGYTVYRDDSNDLATFEAGIVDRPTWRIRDDGTVETVPGHGLPTGAVTTPHPTFYVLPETPRIAIGPDGNLLFALIVYRRDEARVADPAADVGGGILTFTAELSVPDADFQKIRQSLRTTVFGPAAADPDNVVDLSYVQFLEGDVSVAVAGEAGGEAGAEFVRTVIGTGKIGGVGANRRAVMVKLTQDGAALLSQLDKLKTLPINLSYNLQFEHRLLGVKLLVWCNIQSSYTLIQQLRETDATYWDGYLGMMKHHASDQQVTHVTEALVRSNTMGVTVVPATSEVDAETLTALEKEGTDLVTKTVASAVLAAPPPAEFDRSHIEEYIQTFNTALNFTIDRQMVLKRRFTPSSNLPNLLAAAGAKIEDLVAYVDLRTSFFSFLKVPVRVNADFSRLPIDSVVVTVVYRRRSLDGRRTEEVRDSFDFTDGSKIETFLAYANSLAEVTYDWVAEVHYEGSVETHRVEHHSVADNFLVVDVGRLGLLATEFSVGLVDTSLYPAVRVSARYHSAALGRTVEQQFVLDKDTVSAPWVEIIKEEPTNGFEYRTDWLHLVEKGKPPEILSGEWTRTTASRVELDAPLGQQMKVLVLCSGNFDPGSDQIVSIPVALRYEDPGNHYVVEDTLVFTADNQQQTWTVDLHNQDIRDYLFQYKIVYKGGLIRQFPEDGTWLRGEPGFLTVGERYTMRVDVYPLLLTFDNRLRLVELDLEYTDPDHNVDQQNTYVFTAADNAKRTWRVRGAPGGPTGYTFRPRYFFADGTVFDGPAKTQDADAIIIPPPPAG